MINKKFTKFTTILLSGLMMIGILVFSPITVKASNINGWNQNGVTWNYLKNGAMQTGWIKSGATWYFMNVSGAMQTGWVNSGATWYFMNQSGAMKTGWVQDGATWYFLNDGGEMEYSKWVGNYYLSSSGAMAVSTTTPDGYRVGADGCWIPNVVAKVSSRQNPANLDELINMTTNTYDKKVFNSEVIVKDIIRGDEAWTLIKNENMFNDAPKDGYEYILARISFKLTKSSDINTQFNLTTYNFKMVSSSGKDYDYASVVIPKPSLDANLYQGSSNEGYAVFMVEKTDSKPLIVYDKNYDGTGGVWFKGYKDSINQNATPIIPIIPIPTTNPITPTIQIIPNIPTTPTKNDITNNLIKQQYEIDLATLLQKLHNVQNNLSVQTLTKNADGTFQFKYVADASAVEAAQNAYDLKMSYYKIWLSTIQ